MGRHRSNHRSIRTLPRSVPGKFSRSTYRRPLIQQRQSYTIGYRSRQRIRQHRDRERIARRGVGHTQRARLTPHWVHGYPGEFWWRLS